MLISDGRQVQRMCDISNDFASVQTPFQSAAYLILPTISFSRLSHSPAYLTVLRGESIALAASSNKDAIKTIRGIARGIVAVVSVCVGVALCIRRCCHTSSQNQRLTYN